MGAWVAGDRRAGRAADVAEVSAGATDGETLMTERVRELRQDFTERHGRRAIVPFELGRRAAAAVVAADLTADTSA